MKNLIVCLLVFGLLNTGVFAQLGVDPTFGAGGGNFYNYGPLASAEGMAITSDNKIILVSGCYLGLDGVGFPFCALRLNENGQIDNTFAGGRPPFSSGPGVFTSLNSSTYGGVYGVAVQSDDKVVAVGYGPGSGDDNIAMVRYDPDGSLDSSFGSGGLVIADIGPGLSDRAQDIAIQPDGKIVIVGYSGNDQILARYLPNGTPDSSFGTGGVARTTISGSTIRGNALEIMHDGRIMAGGYVIGSSYLVTRHNSDGSPDTTWDGDGILTGPLDSILSIAVQLDGRVVALGSTKALYRFNTNGSPDTTFDGDGISTAVLPVSVYDMAVSASGRITVVGSQPFALHTGGPWWTYRAARYLPDGSPDGYLEIDVGVNRNDGATVVAFDSVGRTVIGGFSAGGSAAVPWEWPLFAAARLSAPPVMPVSVSGRVVGPNGNGIANATVSAQGISAQTNPFGYYTLNNIETNRTYAFTVRAKNDLTFFKRTILVDGQISGLDFVGQQLGSAKSTK